jgi:alpha-tubulin suppressor-like RCC1 family protein
MTTGPPPARRRPDGSLLMGAPAAVAATWLFCVLFAVSGVGVADAVDAVDVWINMTLSGITQVNLNVSELNTTRLLERLKEYETSDVPAFQALATALIRDLNTQLDASDVKAVECSVGSYTDVLQGKCVACPSGKYSKVAKSSAASDCTNCAAGTYSSSVGASSETTCVACPTGTFSGFAGASSNSTCNTCQEGATAPIGSQGDNACVCKDGYYMVKSGPELGKCKICIAGHYCKGNEMNQCPQPSDVYSATSLQGSSVLEECFCKPGYYGRPLGGKTDCVDCAADMSADDAVCTDCPVGAYCPGDIKLRVAQRYTCPENSFTAGVRSTSVNDCVCGSSYKKKASDSATRTYVVGATPCSCTPETQCVSPVGCNPGCTQSEVCPSGLPSGLTCAQGYINLVVENNYIASDVKTWLIAPSSPLATGVTLTFTNFNSWVSGDGLSKDTLQIWQCRNSSLCNTSTAPMRTLSGSPTITQPLVTTAGNTAMYLVWTTASGSPGAPGWKAKYGSTLGCASTTIPLTLTSLKYSKTAQSEQFITQVPDTWPMVVWIGDTLVINKPSTAYVEVDLRNSDGTSALGELRLAGWQASTAGTYYIVDPSRPATRNRALMVLPSDPTTFMVYYSVASGSPSTFTLSGAVKGVKSPDIVMTVGDTLVMSRMPDAPGVAILKSYAGPTVFEYADGVVGQSTSADAMSSLTWDTTLASPGMYYYVSAASMTGVTMGRIYLMERPGGAQCVKCAVGEYCFQGNPLKCPANSNSPVGSTGVENCTCTAGYARELTDMATYVNSHTTDSGGRHSCVVTEGGGLVCWGANEAYQLGLGRKSATWEPPTKVNITGVWNVSLGDDFTCVVLGLDRRTRCWGGNFYGQLGVDSAIVDSGTTNPFFLGNAKLGGGDAAYTTLHLACALKSCCAVISKGSVRSVTCWGRGNLGQLSKGENPNYRKNVGTSTGSGFTDDRESFADTGSGNAQVSFSALGTPLMVTMGGNHACALLQSTEGAVTHCWGHNLDGAVGAGSSSAGVLDPIAVSLGKAGVASSYARALSCYNYVCCAVMSVSFQVKCWGRGAGGRLGNGVHSVGSTAVSMGVNLQAVQLGQYKYAMDVNVGEAQTCALLGDNSVKCWGAVAGQILGDNPPIEMHDLLPSLQLTSGRVALQMGGNGAVTCAVLSDYRVACWGNNDWRQLGGTVLANADGGSSVVQASGTNMTIVNLTGLGVEAMRSTGVPTTLVCSMCSENYFCEGGSLPAQRCPNYTASPTRASTADSCICLQGYAQLTSGSSACQLCGRGSLYCPGGGPSATCPSQSGTTAAGSYDKSQCSCLPGYTGQNGEPCDACGTGKYKDVAGSGACTPCPAGTFSDVTGLNGSWGCTPCAAGSYSNAGVAACTPCDPGKAAKTGSSVCVACGPGFYSFSGSEGCVPCAAGTYDQLKNGIEHTCTSCQAGWASAVLNATNESTCKVCAAGFRSDVGSAICTGCDAGQYSVGGTSECVQCPANSTSLGNSTYRMCTCKAGFYKKFALDKTAFTCEQCPGGQWAGANATACTLCPSGTASAELGAVSAATCAVCVAGMFAPAGSAACGTCPFWSYSLGGNGSCTNCTLGQYASPNSSVCSSCESGRFSDKPIETSAGCQICPRGYFCLGALASVGGLQVRSCPVGTWAPESPIGYRTSASCNACPAGSYCPTPTMKSSCPTGTTSAASSSSQLQCLCEPGYVCQYTKVINAVVTLMMSSDQFGIKAVQDKFLEAVAYASSAPVKTIKIVSFASVAAPPTGGRRLLQVEDGARQVRGGDGELHVFLEIAGGEADGIVNLDGHLAAVGLAPSVDHAWYAPHAVDVSKKGELM